MNYRLRSQQPDYIVQRSGAGEFLVPRVPDKAAIIPASAPPPEPMPHPPSGPIMVGGRVMESSGSYADVFPTLRGLIAPGKGAGILIHAGAYKGEESEMLYRTWWRPLYCFEADYRNLDDLKRRMYDLSQQHPFPIKVLPFAVSNKNGRAMMRLSNYNDGSVWSQSSTLKEPKLHVRQSPELNWNELSEVGTVRLDSFWENAGKPPVHIFFSDIEGAERECIEGAQEMLKHTRWAFFEWSKNERYEGALNAQQTMEMLPGKWECVALWDHGHAGDLLARSLEVDGHV